MFHELTQNKISQDNRNVIISTETLHNTKISLDTCESFKMEYDYPSLISNKTCTISIGDNNLLYSIGCTKYGEHGHEKENIFSFKQIGCLKDITMIDCGINHTICIDFDGNLYSFGRNNYGQLGISDKTLDYTYIPQKINIQTTVTQISCGAWSTLYITNEKKLYGFGYNAHGQLGLGNYSRIVSSPQKNPYLNNVSKVKFGGLHVICGTITGDLYSWGSNYYGQLGTNKPEKRLNWPSDIIAFTCNNTHSLLLNSNGQVYSFGNNNNAQCGINDNNIKEISTPTLINGLPEIKSIMCGASTSCCVDFENNIWVFGCNDSGQLGLGDTTDRIKPIKHLFLSNIIDISWCTNCTFVRTNRNDIYAFGENINSKLGIQSIKQEIPIKVLEENENIWKKTLKSRAKSARK